jgi:hypothetical protein
MFHDVTYYAGKSLGRRFLGSGRGGRDRQAENQSERAKSLHQRALHGDGTTAESTRPEVPGKATAVT